jgi:hypothetical protein
MAGHGDFFGIAVAKIKEEFRWDDDMVLTSAKDGYRFILLHFFTFNE